jgi:hypothetical protein
LVQNEFNELAARCRGFKDDRTETLITMRADLRLAAEDVIDARGVGEAMGTPIPAIVNMMPKGFWLEAASPVQ